MVGLFRKLLDKLNNFCGRKGSNCGGVKQKVINGDLCYERNKKEWPKLDDFLFSFPNFTFTLDNDQNYTLTAHEYLFSERAGSENYCIGILT